MIKNTQLTLMTIHRAAIS